LSVIDKIRKFIEPVDEILIIKDSLLEAMALRRVEADPDFALLLREELVPGLSKILANERTNDKVYL
jgi:hypothetical protein